MSEIKERLLHLQEKEEREEDQNHWQDFDPSGSVEKQVADMKQKVWLFVVLGVVVPLAFVAVFLIPLLIFWHFNPT